MIYNHRYVDLYCIALHLVAAMVHLHIFMASRIGIGIYKACLFLWYSYKEHA